MLRLPLICRPTVIPTVSALLACASIAFAGPRTIDGDTIVIGTEHIRIANIDAPEIRRAQCDAERRLGLVAKRRVEAILASGAMVVTRGDPLDGRLKDRYGRTLATVTVDGADVGETLIAEGLARAWTGKRQRWCDRPAD